MGRASHRPAAVTPMCPSEAEREIVRILASPLPDTAKAQAIKLVALDHAAWWLRHAREGDRVTVDGRVIWDDPEDAA